MLPVKNSRLTASKEQGILDRLASMRLIVTSCALMVPGAAAIVLDAFNNNSKLQKLAYKAGDGDADGMVASVNRLNLDADRPTDCFLLSSCLNEYHLAHDLWCKVVNYCLGYCHTDARALFAFRPAYEKYKSAKEHLFYSNLGLVHHLCGKYRANLQQLEYDDLFQDGCQGLLAAIERFKFGAKNRFFTYAHYWVLAYINIAVKTKDRTVRIPEQALSDMSAISKGRNELSQRFGTRPDTGLLAAHTGLSRQRIDFLDMKLTSVASLNTCMNHDGRCIQDYLEDRSHKPDLLFNESFRQNEVLRLVENCLDAQSNKVIKLRFGLCGNGESMPFKMIARSLNLKVSKVHNIYNHGVKILRNQIGMRSAFDGG